MNSMRDSLKLTAVFAVLSGSADPQGIADALFEVSGNGYEGVTGPIEFDEDGRRSAQDYMTADVFDGVITRR